MENLFVKEITFEKTAEVTFLDKDSTKWVKQIISAFLHEYPFLQEQPVMLDWIKKDSKKGYGVGVIKVLGGHIPVIVQDYKLFPMDVFAIGGNYIPLNNTVLRTLLEAPDAFGGIAASAPKSNHQLFDPPLDDTSFSPTNTGRYGMTEGLSEIRPAKTASIIDQISYVDYDSVREIVDFIDSNPSVKANFEKNGTLGVIEKLAAKTHTSKTASLKNYIRNLEIDRQYIYSDSKGNHFLKQANSSLDKTWTTRISEDEAREFSILAKKGENTTKIAEKLAIFPVRGQKDQYMAIDESGNWQTYNEFNEKRAEVINLPEVTNPSKGDFVAMLDEDGISEPYEVNFVEKVGFEQIDGRFVHGKGDKMIYFDERGHYKIADYQNGASGANLVKDREDYIPKIGDYGIIVTKTRASEPFEVTELQKIANAPSWEIQGFSGLEKVGFHVVNSEITGFEPHEEFQNHFYVSKTAQFIKLTKEDDSLEQKMMKNAENSGDIRINLSNGFETIDVYYSSTDDRAKLEKKAANRYEASKNVKFIKLQPKSTKFNKIADFEPKQHYVGRDNAGFYYLKGPEFEKYAENGHSSRNLTQDDAAWAIIHCGGHISDLKKLAGINNREIKPLDGRISAPKTISQVKELAKTAYSKYAAKIKKLDFNLIKEASVLKDQSSVDAVLSLGLLKKHNIEEYLDVIPSYETVMSELAKLLLTARLGLSQLPPEPVKRAMDAITDVTLLLKAVKSTIKEVK